MFLKIQFCELPVTAIFLYIELTDFSEEDRRIINSLADFIGGLSETAGKTPEESHEDNAEPSSFPAIPVQE